MAITVDFYNRSKDYDAVSEFLSRHYTLKTVPLNWCQARWEYMHFHPLLDRFERDLNKCGIWRDNGRVVALAHFEHQPGKIYFQLNPKYSHLKEEMLDYAEKYLKTQTKDGKNSISIYINEYDSKFNEILIKRGYKMDRVDKEELTWIALDEASLDYTVPKGFEIQSLAEENNLAKVDRVLHRGFNHEGEAPKDGIKGRKKMQSAPNFRKDLTIVAVNEKGDYVSFAGSWYDKINKFTYVEPVATDPDYRRMGLGRACVLETIKRCKKEGARIAVVGSGQDFYKALGFKIFFRRNCWIKDNL